MIAEVQPSVARSPAVDDCQQIVNIDDAVAGDVGWAARAWSPGVDDREEVIDINDAIATRRSDIGRTAEIAGFIGANAVPCHIAAERVDGTDFLAAGRNVARRLLVRREAIARAGSAARAAEVVGSTHANAVPCGIAAEWISCADGIATFGNVARGIRMRCEAIGRAGAAAGGAEFLRLPDANAVP